MFLTESTWRIYLHPNWGNHGGGMTAQPYFNAVHWWECPSEGLKLKQWLARNFNSCFLDPSNWKNSEVFTSVWRVNLYSFKSCIWKSIRETVNKFVLKSCIPFGEFAFLLYIPQRAIKTHQFKKGEEIELIFKGKVRNQLLSV